TEKLSLITPMVLRNSGRVGSRRFFSDGSSLSVERPEGMTCFIRGGEERERQAALRITLS
ncbi:hypothetical protein ACIXAX_20505, partial [Bacteroides fragilis]